MVTFINIRKAPILSRLISALPRMMTFRLFKPVAAECFYVVVLGQRYGGKPSASPAIRFMDVLRESLLPTEHLEFHNGRIVLVGISGTYRLHFNFEGYGKHAGWTADFRDPACPIVPLRRISIRMLRKQKGHSDTPPRGMFDPRIIACIPDPADRYASLLLGNHKLTERVPREILEEVAPGRASPEKLES